jgi:tetratricopeptide (TPR) repeat protein
LNALILVALRYRTEQLSEQDQLVIQITEDWAHGDGRTTGSRSSVVGHVPVSLLRGQWEQARSDAASALATGSRPAAMWICRHVLGVTSRARGAADEAWTQVLATLPDGPATEPGTRHIQHTLEMQQLAIELALDAHDLPAADAWLEANERWLTWSGAVLGQSEYYVLRGSYHRQAGDHLAASAAATIALEHASDPRQPLALISAHRLLGALLTDSGEYDSANDHLDASLALAKACEAPFERALTLLAVAELRLAQADPEAARTLLMEVRVICEPLDARPMLARVTTLEHEAGSAP